MRIPDPDTLFGLLRELATSPGGDPFEAAERGRQWALAVHQGGDSNDEWLALGCALMGYLDGCRDMYQAFLRGRLVSRAVMESRLIVDQECGE